LPWNLVHPQKSLKTSLEEIELIYSWLNCLPESITP
jgi:hypothetical protein